MAKYRRLLVVEFDSYLSESLHVTLEDRLNTFRDKTKASTKYGLTIYQATPEDISDFMGAGPIYFKTPIIPAKEG